MLRIAFVHNFCSHYTLKLFEKLATRYEIDFYFCSKGDDPYWLEQHGVRQGDFNSEYLDSRWLGGTRIVPTLPQKLLSKPYDIYIKGITGRYEIAVTYFLAHLRRKPFILWSGIWNRLQTPLHRIVFPLTRHLYTHSDAIIVYGEHVRRYLIGEGTSPERVFIAPHSVDNEHYGRPVSANEKYVLRKQLGLPDHARIILYIGRFVSEKGLAYLLEAYGMLGMDDTVLLLVGTGPERTWLEQKVTQQGLQGKVFFCGYVPIEDTPSFYSIANVSVLPSVTTETFKEPWGLTVNEAFNQGVPVIASDSVGAGAGGLLQHGVNGAIVREGSSSDLLDALRTILINESLRQEWGRSAREAVHRWNYDEMVKGFEAALHAVMYKEMDEKSADA